MKMLNKNSKNELVEQENSLEYKNSKLTIEKRVADLLSRMNLEEKGAQLMGCWRGGEDFTEEMNDFVKMKEIFGNGCHSVHPATLGIRETIELRNKIQI